MQLVTEMDLPLLPVEQADFSANPMPDMEKARQQHPWLARSNMGSYLVHGYQAVKDMICMDDKLLPYYDGIAKFYGVEDTEWGRFMSEMLPARHGPEHARLRESFAAAFTPRNINRHRGLMRQVLSTLLDEWAPKREFDFVEFASYYPITVFCGLVGMTTEPVNRLRGLLEAQAASHGLNRDALPAMLEAFDHLWSLVDTLTIEREKQAVTGDGLLDLMIAAKKAGKINDTEIRQNLVSLLTGGYDTTKNMLGLTIHMLLQHPDLWERCAEDRVYCDKVTEEMLRHSSIGSVYRWVGEDFVYADVKFPKDSVLTFLMGMAGRDPSAFPEPMVFQPEKVHANRHVAFGRGVHICIGQYLARAQIEEAVHIIAQRLRNAKIAGEVKWRQYLGVWGLSSLPMEFEPAPLGAGSAAA